MTGSRLVEGALGPRRLHPVQPTIVEGFSPISAHDGSLRRKYPHKCWPSRVLKSLQLVQLVQSTYPKHGSWGTPYEPHEPSTAILGTDLIFYSVAWIQVPAPALAPIRRDKVHFRDTFTAERLLKVRIFLRALTLDLWYRWSLPLLCKSPAR